MNSNNIKLPPLPEGWETELLDWVSACQSAYHIDNTPGHRFGGLGSNLEENRSEIICFVRGLIEDSATAAVEAGRASPQPQDREDADLKEALLLALEYWADRQQRYKNRSPVWVQKARAALGIDHIRRVEGGGE